jgi:hypothetical protein
MAWTDTKCGKHIPGDRLQHCPACHETFSSTSSGDRHRIGGWDRHGGPRRCLHPTDAGLIQNPRGTWHLPGTYDRDDD